MHSKKMRVRVRNWPAKFCRSDFFLNLTFVTTFWDYTDALEGEALNSRLARRQELWREFLDGGATTYQHGKVYDKHGEETEGVLSWYGPRDTLVSQGKAMLSRVCRDSPTVQPKVVRELSGGSSCENVSAANVFCPAPATPPPTTENPGQSTLKDKLHLKGPLRSSHHQVLIATHGNPTKPSRQTHAVQHQRATSRQLAGIALLNSLVSFSTTPASILEEFNLGLLQFTPVAHFLAAKLGPLGISTLNTLLWTVSVFTGKIPLWQIVKFWLGFWVWGGEPGSEAHNIRFNRELGSRITENGGRWPF
jgi:hypothetical protein